MSRRKQRKPQQLISDGDNSTSSENGDTAGEEIQVCEKCCAQFEDPSDFARHKERCPVDNAVVVFVDNQDESRREHENGIKKDYSSLPCSPESFKPGNKTMVAGQYEKEPNSQTISSARSQMDKKGVGPSQRFLIPNGGLVMDGLPGPKIGMAPLSQEAVPGGQSATAPISIPMILEELRVLQQRQIHQMQITEQICQQVLMLGSISMGTTNPETPPQDKKTATKPVHAFSPSKQSDSFPESTKTFCRDEASRPTFFHLYNPHSFGSKNFPNIKEKTIGGISDKADLGQPSLSSSPSSQHISPHAVFPPGLPTLTSSLFLGTRVLDNMPSHLKQKNNESLRTESPLERSSGKHKCRFCAKVFGSDSALQIHLRSHTGERPYKCNICGNRFTTRGNLKVHFHRHREKYPHIQMNPHPVPEHLDYVLTSNGLPYGMSVPPEKAEEEAIDKKPIVPPIMSTEGFNFLSSSTNPGLPSFNKLVLVKASDASIKSSNVSSKIKSDENTPPMERPTSVTPDISGRMPFSKLVTSLPSWALLANHFKSGSLPFSYTVEPLAYSETSKLQQLVEKIDKQPTIPNQCVICLRVLSCPRALRLHYNQHGGERPFKCKICGRAFSTKGNLKAHFVGHKIGLSSKLQNSCPICQKKFTNAVTLQQHIRMHLGGQIPNGETLSEACSKTETIEDKSIPDFSDDISTDDDSLDISESDSDKAAQVESEISSMDDDSATSVVKKQDDDNTSLSNIHQPVPITITESVVSSEQTITTTTDPDLNLQKSTSMQLSNEDQDNVVTIKSPKLTYKIQSKESEKVHPEKTQESDNVHTEQGQESENMATEPSPASEERPTEQALESEERHTEPTLKSENMDTELTPETRTMPTEPNPESEKMHAQPRPESAKMHTEPAPESEKIHTESTPESEEIHTESTPKSKEMHIEPMPAFEEMHTEPAAESEKMHTELKPESETKISTIPEEIHTCNFCAEKLPSLESLGEHERNHTKDGLFHCLVCNQSFLEASILKKHMLQAHQVHMSTHVWNNNSTRRGRRLSLDNLGPLLSGTPVKLQDFLPRDIPTQLVGVSPLSFWNQYTAYLTGGPASVASNITATTAVISPPALIGLRAAKFGNFPAGRLVEVKEKSPSVAENPHKSPIKEEK